MSVAIQIAPEIAHGPERGGVLSERGVRVRRLHGARRREEDVGLARSRRSDPHVLFAPVRVEISGADCRAERVVHLRSEEAAVRVARKRQRGVGGSATESHVCHARSRLTSAAGRRAEYEVGAPVAVDVRVADAGAQPSRGVGARRHGDVRLAVVDRSAPRAAEEEARRPVRPELRRSDGDVVDTVAVEVADPRDDVREPDVAAHDRSVDRVRRDGPQLHIDLVGRRREGSPGEGGSDDQVVRTVAVDVRGRQRSPQDAVGIVARERRARVVLVVGTRPQPREDEDGVAPWVAGRRDRERRARAERRHRRAELLVARRGLSRDEDVRGVEREIAVESASRSVAVAILVGPVAAHLASAGVGTRGVVVAVVGVVDEAVRRGAEEHARSGPESVPVAIGVGDRVADHGRIVVVDEPVTVVVARVAPLRRRRRAARVGVVAVVVGGHVPEGLVAPLVGIGGVSVPVAVLVGVEQSRMRAVSAVSAVLRRARQRENESGRDGAVHGGSW